MTNVHIHLYGNFLRKERDKVFKNANFESLELFSKFGGAMLGLLMLVWIIALLTPKAAKLIDRIIGKKPHPNPERVEDNNISENNCRVYSIFEDRPTNAENTSTEKNDTI